MTGRRPALLLVAVGALVALFAYGRTWVVVQARPAGLPALSRELTGRDLEPGAGFLPLLLLAAVLGLWATGGWWRRAVGVLVVVAGTACAAGALRTPARAADELGRLAGLTGTTTVSTAPWWWLAALGAALAAAGGVLAVAGGHRWGSLSARYDRSAASAGPGAAAPTASSAWDLLDAGGDPTLDPAPDPAPDPVVDAPGVPERPGGPEGSGSGTMSRGTVEEDTP